ncbi:unnamed protein product [Penicillium pancosmium]
MAGISSYDDILNSLDENAFVSFDGGSLSPTLEDWSSPTDLEDIETFDLELSESDSSWVDPLESAITATRNGSAPVLSTLSQFTAILSQTGIHGPRLLKKINLSTRGIKIGSGAQFTVFKDPSFQGEVIKRVNVPLSNKADQRFAATMDYRLQLRTLCLEVLSLCNPIMRAHPNITSLLAWGFDYPFADMAVPVLFMEEALMPLSDFLVTEKRGVDIRYQLALDVVNGLEALHNLSIVHGDVKPDNVLVFPGPNDKVPFRAKMSDFGVCVDLEAPDAKFELSDYRGTPAWLAPEVIAEDISKFGKFSPDMMFRFDSYSLALVLLSVFTADGQPLTFNKGLDGISDQVSKLLNDCKDMPSPIRMEARKAALKLLAEDPRSRPLPNQALLKTDTPAYASCASTNTPTGVIDPIYNKGPLFWYRLDESIRIELETQHALSKEGNAPPFTGDVLLGIAQTITGRKPTYLDRLLTYLGDAAKAGYSPARAIYSQIMEAHGQESEFSQNVLDNWMLQAVSEGYYFAKPGRLENEIEDAKQKFRMNGGFCSDPFLGKPDVKAAMSRQKVLNWMRERGFVVDRKGNTLLHAAAAFGASGAVRAILDTAEVGVDVKNENEETPLYKAFQAGQKDVIEILLNHGADASCRNRQKNSPLHWLFTIPDDAIHDITKLMVERGADIDAKMEPVVKDNSGGYPEKIQILHYPFELPHGTPLHWACFFRNRTAMDALISFRADINAIYHRLDSSTTPLALSAYFGEPEIARHLLSRGADGTLLDPMGRNTLHQITKYFPDRHGYLPHQWHYWIRHGNWNKHFEELTELVKILVEGGADVNAKENGRFPLTPIAAAAELGVWDGGMINALLDAGADLEESILAGGDTVLHCWVAVTGPRLDYPDSYIPTLDSIVRAMPNIDIPTRYEEDTPLHTLTTTYHSEDEFETACNILLGHSPPADIDRVTRRGATALSIALETHLDPGRRGRFILGKGANSTIVNGRGRDIFYSIANNAVLSDKHSHDLIQHFLHALGSSMQQVFEKRYLSDKENSRESIFAAASHGKPRTLALLLSLGLKSSINILDTTKSPPRTPLDQALHSAEIIRRDHIQALASYKIGRSRTNALDRNLVYGDNQGPPDRAAEAYRCFPEVIQILRDAGALRKCELEGNSDGDYIEQPADWDKSEIQKYGFTKETQPNAEAWRGLYDLAMYSNGWGWLNKLIGGKKS